MLYNIENNDIRILKKKRIVNKQRSRTNELESSIY